MTKFTIAEKARVVELVKEGSNSVGGEGIIFYQKKPEKG